MLLIGLLVGFSSLAQSKKGYQGIPSIEWVKLTDITYVKKKDQFGEYDAPVFSQKVKEMEGKVIYLPGYMIPFDMGYTETHFILSALPVNACFFCGQGGPESVIEVFAKKPVRFHERPVEIKGRLKLNTSDPDALFYQLIDAEFVEVIEF
jgi:hypothetical protein